MIREVLFLTFIGSCFSLNFNRIFTNHMILQRDVETNFIFGTASGNVVKISVGGKTVEGNIQGGKFRIKLPRFPAGGPYNIQAQEFPSQKKIALTNILFGDVYFCSGQSFKFFLFSKYL